MNICTRCGETYITSELPATGHNWGAWTVTTAATCTAAGVETRVCANDASHTETRPIAALGHNFVNGVCSRCSAVDPNYIPDDPTAPRVVISNATVRPGETVRVTISIENNPGICTMTLQTNYDKSIFTTGKAIAGDFGSITKGTVTAGNRWVWANDYNVCEDGTFVSFDLTVAEGVADGQYPITLLIKEAANDVFDDVEFTAVSAVITVRDVIYGDANGDGVITGKDASIIKQYVANYDDETGETTADLIFAAADVNADGKITGKDASMILQYVANYDDETGTSTVVLGPAP